MPIRTFEVTSPHYKSGPPSDPGEFTNPLTVSLGGSTSDPNNQGTVLLILVSPSPTTSGRMWTRLNIPSVPNMSPGTPDDAKVTRVWRCPPLLGGDVLLAELDRQGVLRRTGLEAKRGREDLAVPCVDILVPGEWSKRCNSRGRTSVSKRV